MELKVYHSFDELPFDGERWNALLAMSETRTVFQTYEWHRAWWPVFGVNRSLWLIVAYNNDQPVGIAPLALSTAGGTREIHFVADAKADYCDVIAGEHKIAFLCRLVDLLHERRESWDCLRLQNVPQESSTPALLQGNCRARHLFYFNSGRTDCPAITLSPTDSALADFLRRKSLVRPYNHFRSLGSLGFHEIRDPTAAQEALTEFFQQHIQRWSNTSSPSLFLDERNQRFYRELTRRLTPTDWLSFCVVTLDDEPLAFHYGFTYGSSFIWYKPSFNVKHAQHSPGNLLLRFLFDHAVHLGKTTFDFTIGNEAFKSRYSTVVRRNVNLRIYSTRPRYWLARSGKWVRHGAKHLLRTMKNLSGRAPEHGVDTRATEARPVQSRLNASAQTERQNHPLAKAPATSGRHGRMPIESMNAATSSMSLAGTLRHALKLVLAYGLHYSGILSLLRRIVLRRHAVVLMYHRVLPADQWRHTFSSDAIIVTPETFARHMAFLQRNLRPVSMDTFVSHFSNATDFHPGTCLVTFDDGWHDNLEHALPILREQRIPATIFLPTAYIGSGKCFWQERLTRLLYAVYRHPSLHAHPVVRQLGIDAVLASDETQARSRIKQFVRSLKGTNSGKAAAMIDALTPIASGHDDGVPDVDVYVDWNEVREMQRVGVRFHSHAVSHSILPSLSPADIRQELDQSREIIARETGAPVETLAYPNGDVDETTVAATRDAGYRVAFTTVAGTVSVNDHPLRLRRINIHELATNHLPLFHARLVGLL